MPRLTILLSALAAAANSSSDCALDDEMEKVDIRKQAASAAVTPVHLSIFGLPVCDSSGGKAAPAVRFFFRRRPQPSPPSTIHYGYRFLVNRQNRSVFPDRPAA